MELTISLWEGVILIFLYNFSSHWFWRFWSYYYAVKQNLEVEKRNREIMKKAITHNKNVLNFNKNLEKSDRPANYIG